MHKSAAVFAMLAAASLQAQTTSIQRAEDSINAENIRAQVRLLADDLYEGRYPGTRGSDLSALYIATQFALDGLEPAGDNGTYLQHINFVGMTAKPAETTFSFVPKSGSPGGPIVVKFGDDFVVSNQTLTPVVDIDAPIVFVGYGATAPEFNWDDYAGVDVRGKVILCIVGDPPSDDPKFFAGKALTYYGRWTYKFEQAARKGAVGALIIHRTDLASYGWNVVRNSNSAEKTFLRDDKKPRLEAASWIQLDVAKKLFEASGMTLDGAFDAAGKRGFHAVELPVRLHAHIASDVRPFQASNVLGKLRGAAPGEAVMYSAHYDHLGMKTPRPGETFKPGEDIIFNGAADNGTGSGMLLELARAWSAGVHTGGLQLPHDIFFASVTAEEQGLLGSEYLGQNPPVPAKDISLDINYDMILPIGIPEEINVNGAQRTTFYPEVQAAAKKFSLAIVPDPRPGAGSYYRSDHFSLSRVGIPAFSVDTGSLWRGHDRAWGEAQEKDYNDNRYHNVTDNYTPTMNFTGDAYLAKFGMDLGWQVIHAPHTIEWLPGDEFEAARLKSQAQ